MSIFCLFHAFCSDGSGAHYAAWKKFGDKATYIPVAYGKPFPEEIIKSDSEIYIMDFSYPRAVLDNIYKKVKKLMVLDHHKTAEEDLRGAPYAIFDMNRSGAVIAWEYFHGKDVPMLLKYIQDRDLWTWKLPHTEDALNALRLVGDMGDISEWDEFEKDLAIHVRKGSAISEYRRAEVELKTKPEVVTFLTYEGRKVALVNASVLISEIGNTLCKKYDVDYSMIYFIDQTGVVNMSLRAIGRCDVSSVAKAFGGGGHANSAGFRTNLEFLAKLYRAAEFEKDGQQ